MNADSNVTERPPLQKRGIVPLAIRSILRVITIIVAATAVAWAQTKPNLIFILADELG